MFERALVYQLAGGLIVCAAVFVWWRFFPERLEAFRVWLSRLSRRRLAIVLVASFLGPGIRLAILPYFPAPDPIIADEFGHLLVADTLLAGRLANPPHPYWRHFDVPHVLQRPAYAAKYPLGIGASLAVGKMLAGSHWFGVWLAMVFCCGAMAFLFYRYLPAPAAAAGSLLFSIRFGLDSYWVNSYWGGAVAAGAGALALAALPSLLGRGRKRAAVVVVASWSVAWIVRPFEAALLGLVIAAAMLLQLARKWRSAERGSLLRCIVVLAAGVAVCLGIVAMHNHSVTGSALKFPFQLHAEQKIYHRGFVWEDNRERPEGAERIPVVSMLIDDYPDVWIFYLGVPLTLPSLLGLRYLLVRSRTRWLVLILMGALCWSFLYPWCLPHYIAPYACLIFLPAPAGLYQLSKWRLRGAPAGLVVAAVCVFGAIYPACSLRGTRSLVDSGMHNTPRSQFEERLVEAGGKHVVFVYYPEGYRSNYRWHYNTARIDSAPVVWARDLEAERNADLLDYFGDRHAWQVRAIDSPVLEPYRPMNQADPVASPANLR